VIGSDIAFQDRGTHALKRVDGRWQLLTVICPLVEGRRSTLGGPLLL
jgi:hypothetical protein